MELNEQTTRIRMNVAITTKGVYQFDITSEASNVEEAQKNLSEAIDKVRATMEAKGIEEAGKE